MRDARALVVPGEIIPKVYLVKQSSAYKPEHQRQIELQHVVAHPAPNNDNNDDQEEQDETAKHYMILFVNSVCDAQDPCYSSVRFVLFAAITKGYISLIKIAVRKNIIDLATMEAFLVDRAIECKKVGCLKALLRYTPCLEFIRTDQHPVIYAVLEGSEACLEALIRHGANISARSRERTYLTEEEKPTMGKTALEYAGEAAIYPGAYRRRIPDAVRTACIDHLIAAHETMGLAIEVTGVDEKVQVLINQRREIYANTQRTALTANIVTVRDLERYPRVLIELIATFLHHVPAMPIRLESCDCEDNHDGLAAITGGLAAATI